MLRREIEQKKAEKEGMKMLEEMVWGAPRGSMPIPDFVPDGAKVYFAVNAPGLVQFWVDHFKAQVEARSGQPLEEIASGLFSNALSPPR